MKPSKPSCGGRWLPGAEDRKREKWEIEKIEKSVPKENREKSVPEENRERKRRAQAALIVESSSNDGGAREREGNERESGKMRKERERESGKMRLLKENLGFKLIILLRWFNNTIEAVLIKPPLSNNTIEVV
jgi:hypothetical protein